MKAANRRSAPNANSRSSSSQDAPTRTTATAISSGDTKSHKANAPSSAERTFAATRNRVLSTDQTCARKNWTRRVMAAKAPQDEILFQKSGCSAPSGTRQKVKQSSAGTRRKRKLEPQLSLTKERRPVKGGAPRHTHSEVRVSVTAGHNPCRQHEIVAARGLGTHGLGGRYPPSPHGPRTTVSARDPSESPRTPRTPVTPGTRRSPCG